MIVKWVQEDVETLYSLLNKKKSLSTLEPDDGHYDGRNM